MNSLQEETPLPVTQLQQNRGAHPRLRLQLPQQEFSTANLSPCSVHFHPNEHHTRDGLRPPENHDLSLADSTNLEGGLPKRKKTLNWSFARPNLQWIRDNSNRSRLRPVIRSAVAGWISLLLIVIPHTQRMLGQASFLLIIAAFLSPPIDPFTAVVEQQTVILLTVVGSFAWSCLGIRLSNLARSEFNLDADTKEVINGRYIEAGPSIICAMFLCIGTAIMQYLRARMGQGKPVVAALILSFTAMDSSLTTSPLFPYPNYQIGQEVVIPIAFHSVISLTCSLLVLPESVHSQLSRRFHAVFIPLAKALRGQPELLNTSPNSPDFSTDVFNQLIGAAEAALGPLAATGRLMKKDISWGRFAARDFNLIHELSRRLTVRANGMAFYYKIMDPSRHKFGGTPAPSLIGTPATSPAPSGPPSPFLPLPSAVASEKSPWRSTASLPARRRPNIPHRHSHNGSVIHASSPHHNHHHHRHNYFNAPHAASLFDEVRARTHAPEGAVGVFESQRYLNLETRFTHAGADALRAQMMRLLGESAGALLLCAADTLEHVTHWLRRVNDDQLWNRYLFSRHRARRHDWEEVAQENQEAKARLEACLDEFRNSRRHRVLDLYRSVVDPTHIGSPTGEELPPHRYLFQCYLYQYHLIRFAHNLNDILVEISRLEREKRRCRLWLPDYPLQKLFSWSRWDPASNTEPEEDEDPDVISGIDPRSHDSLGSTSRRDPDALPPGNVLEAAGTAAYHLVAALGHGNAVFAFKAGTVTALLSLPAFLPQSAGFALSYRYTWAIVLGQTTLSRFRGDTVFGLITRLTSTFFGGLVGLVMWYISTGNGRGNSYGIAALTAVCFPLFFFVRIYYTGPPITVIFFFLTSQLVIGYSWQDTHLPSLSLAGWGFEVAWRRFILVSIGVTSAFIFSFFPPTTTLRRYLRTTYATTTSQLGQLYCDIVSFATVHDKATTDQIVQDLIAIRMKLNRAKALQRNVFYEFSLQGKWPTERYNRILDIQMEIAYLLSHLRSVEDHLDPEWARAFLRRTRFLESDFQGDVLAVFCMISTALRTGSPLPQITPCPLLDRFVANHGGLIAPRNDPEDDYGLPRVLTIASLENEQYLYFSVGVATAFGIVTRLDRLMLATKELVGEQYHIRGIGLSQKNGLEKHAL